MLNLSTHEADGLVALQRELRPTDGEREQLAIVLAEAEAKLPIGSVVKINLTSYTAEVVGFNTALGGFYPGIRYPVRVKIVASKDPRFGNAVGDMFEYNMESLTRIDNAAH